MFRSVLNILPGPNATRLRREFSTPQVHRVAQTDRSGQMPCTGGVEGGKKGQRSLLPDRAPWSARGLLLVVVVVEIRISSLGIDVSNGALVSERLKIERKVAFNL